MWAYACLWLQSSLNFGFRYRWVVKVTIRRPYPKGRHTGSHRGTLFGSHSHTDAETQRKFMGWTELDVMFSGVLIVVFNVLWLINWLYEAECVLRNWQLLSWPRNFQDFKESKSKCLLARTGYWVVSGPDLRAVYLKVHLSLPSAMSIKSTKRYISCW